MRSLTRIVYNKMGSVAYTMQNALLSSKTQSHVISPIKVTARAAERIKEMLSDKQDQEILGVRISVKKRGCNGYSYQMNYAKSEDLDKKNNEIVDAHGIRIFVDTKAIFFIVGTTMDYSETDIASEFTFINPNAKGECGCGESFNV